MKKWLKLCLVIFVFALISFLFFLIFKANNLTNIEKIQEILEKNKNFSIILYILISVIFSTLFCFIPLLGTTLVSLSCLLFGTITGFFTSLAACFISSSILFFVGDKLGERFVIKLIGKNELSKTQNMLDTKSKLILPILLAIPGIPDDAICLIAGMTKMKYKFFATVCFFFEAIDIGLVCFFSSGLINWSNLRVIDWIFIANFIIIDIFLIKKLESHLQNKNKK